MYWRHICNDDTNFSFFVATFKILHLDFLIPGDQSLVELFVLALTLLLIQIKCQVKCLNHFHPLHRFIFGTH